MTKLESGAIVPNAASARSRRDRRERSATGPARFSRGIGSKSISPTDLPMVQIDAVLFEQVLFNILDNAAKYAPAGTTIRIQSWRDRFGVGLQMIDEGDGIPPGDLEHIFDKFYRAQKADHVVQGLGWVSRSRAASSRR